MRRIGHLFEKVTNFENLFKAAHKAFRGKKKMEGPARFCFHLETEIFKLQAELCSGAYCMKPYTQFEINDPKLRKICAADFRDRVVHHAICNVLEPIFDKSLFDDTFACRKGKVSHAAIRRAQEFARRLGEGEGWWLWEYSSIKCLYPSPRPSHKGSGV